jgi:hypothetical protein
VHDVNVLARMSPLEWLSFARGPREHATCSGSTCVTSTGTCG